MNKIFLEVIIANGFDDSAIKILKYKKNLRLIDASNFKIDQVHKFSSIGNSVLLQTEDNNIFSKKDFKVVSKRKPNKSLFDDLIFAFNVCRYVKSNAIVIVSNNTTVGIGSGQIE